MFPTTVFMLALTFTTIFIFTTNANELKTYIVHLTSPQNHEIGQLPRELEKWYYSFLPTNTTGSNQKPEMVHMYHNVLTGFAAKLSAEQAKAIEEMDGVLSVRPESIFKLHTTRTPHFLGLHQNSGFWRDSNYGKGIIIGLLDSGITPAHPSFNDKGVPPPPARWKGKCEVAGCNNKLIGMRNFYHDEYDSPIDRLGHGTHTSSTAAGNSVDNANVFGNANGTSIGMAPLAHLAMYRVCFEFCPDSAILAGMDAAIEDGVDVISISLGGYQPNFYNDPIAVGAFAAIQKGIFVSCSAGNSGPKSSTLDSQEPWVLSVGASTIDRRIRTTVFLGNKKLLDGESLYQPKDFNQKLFRPLVYPGKNDNQNVVSWCFPGSFDHVDVKGKVVMCMTSHNTDAVGQGKVVKDAGGAAVILMNVHQDGYSTFSDPHVLPASHVSYNDGVTIQKYLNSTSSPVATLIFHGTITGIDTAPEVISFSSRGPSKASPGILKPDVIGPGVNILAAWSESIENITNSKANFSVISGTSMSCPHLAGLAALLKSSHPDWSPAAIKSALMTTASQVSLNGHPIPNEQMKPADIFAIGAGRVNISKATHPGLVFDIEPDDYIPYLCGLNYTAKQVRMIVKKTVNCSKTIPEAQLNYPSFAIELASGDSKRYTRTVTNVGVANSTYSVGDLSLPKGIHVRIHPPELRFMKLKQKLIYEMTFIRDSNVEEEDQYAQGYMTWTSGNYTVRTPFAFRLI